MTDISPIALSAGSIVSPAVGSASPRLFNERQVADLLGVTTRTLQRWRISGEGPAWVRIGVRLIRYAETDVAAWKERRTYAHRAAELAGGGNG
jgi:excisionase family DNA binding protein